MVYLSFNNGCIPVKNSFTSNFLILVYSVEPLFFTYSISMWKRLCSTYLMIAFFGLQCLYAQSNSLSTAEDQNTFLAEKDTISAPAFNSNQIGVDNFKPVSGSLKTQFKTPLTPQPLSLRSVVVPTAMIGYGAYTFANSGLKSLNLSVREEVWQERKNPDKQFPLDDYSVFAPAIAVYALNMAGVKGQHNFVDRTLLFGMSNLVGHGIVSTTKKLSGVIRPDSSNRYSFPSGHTTKAFISAEFLRQEYKNVSPWIGVAGYAVAAGTGFLRMYNNRHWLNDVIAGAGVGIISTRLSYWLYPKLKNTFLTGRKNNTVLMPTYENGAVGLGMIMQMK